MTYYVETFRPAYPQIGISTRVHTAKGYSSDVLSPCLTTLFQVDNATTKAEAIALVLEHAAGKRVTVRRLIPAA